MSPTDASYIRPGSMIQHVANRIVRWTGAVPTLKVPGRRTGKPQRVPCHVLDLDGERYLVSARGESEWVRNLRAAGVGQIRRGLKHSRFKATEVGDADRPRIIAGYRSKWDNEVKRFFEALPEASQHPVFRVEDAG